MMHRRTLATVLAAGAFAGVAGAAQAGESCARSRDYLLGGLAGELPQAPISEALTSKKLTSGELTSKEPTCGGSPAMKRSLWEQKISPKSR